MRRAPTILLAVLALVAMAAGNADAIGYFGSHFAVVNPNGTIDHSSGVQSILKKGKGVYQLDFNPSLETCGYSALITGETPGQITAKPPVAGRIEVHTFTAKGAPANRSFSLTVICAPGLPPS
jgi:hypothetical protein